MTLPDDQAWHAKAAAQVLVELDTSTAGLDAEETARRSALFGPNRMPVAARPNPLMAFLRQFNSALMPYLHGTEIGRRVD